MDLFAVIADPTRRQMIDMLRDGELPAGAFVAAFPAVTQPAISQHLRVLRESGVTHVRADRQRRLYSLNTEALAPVREWIAPHAPAPLPQPAAAPEAAEAKPKPRNRTKPAPEPVLMLDLFG